MRTVVEHLAEFEKKWGGLFRWVVTICFTVLVYAVLHVGDIRYEGQTDYKNTQAQTVQALDKINDKLEVVITQEATTQQHVIDVEKRLDDAEARRASQQEDAPASLARQ